MSQRGLLTTREAAEFLSISEKTLWNLSAPRGPIPVVRIKRCVRYSMDALLEFIQQQQEQA